MARDSEDVDGISEKSITADGEADDATMERIFDLRSFLEGLDDSSDENGDKTKQLKKKLDELPRGKINVRTNDFLVETVLHVAVRQGLVWAATTLLKSGADALATDDDGDMPFHIAADYGYTEMVERFLEEENRSDLLNACAKWGMTALHRAAYAGNEIIIQVLLGAGAEVDVKDQDGWTPLMAATKGGHLTSMRTLLDEKKYGQANIQDNERQTPFLVAFEDGNSEGVDILLGHMPDEMKCDPDVYQRLLLYEVSTPHDGMLKCQKSIIDTLMKKQETFDEALLWAAAKYERHGIAKKLLIRDPDLKTNELNVIELASQQKNPDVLWWLIATSPRTGENTEIIKSALSKVAQAKETEAKTKAQQEGNSRTMRPGGKRGNKIKPYEDNYDTTAPAGEMQPSVWRPIIDILKDPQIAQVYEDSAILEPPRLKSEHSDSVKEFEALIARFYKAKHVSSTIRRTRGLNDTVYDKGPTRIMTKAINDLKNTLKKSSENKNQNPKSSRLQATYGEDNLRFTYIHLPATNMDWMKDLLLRIMVDDKNSAASYHEVSSFLQSTWFEIPDRTSESRFMRPQFAERIPIASTGKRQDEVSPLKRSEEEKGTASNDAQREETQDSGVQKTNDHEVNSQDIGKQETTKEKEREEDDFIPSSALYMPFLSFATQTEDHGVSHQGANKAQDGPSEKSKRLIAAYKRSVVHSSATLDEAYYHFEAGEMKAQGDRYHRNRTQVVTKQLEQKMPEGSQHPMEHWPLLRVNQIWIWTIANKWVICATSHPVDDVEQSWLDGFTEQLNRQIEAGGARSQPGSTKDMMKAIVEYCIGSYERRRTYRDPSPQDPSHDWKTGLSIRQLFSNYINHIGRKETDLFQKLENESNVTSKSEKEFRDATIEAKNLFSEIKDIRDELNIIKSIVNYQNIVQRKLFEKDPTDSGLAASYIVNDITEMESLASRIQSAVNSTLSLLHSEIANSQAAESVKQGDESASQGKVLMAFTLITVVFLPLSFLSSLFALDVESFQKAPAWAFGVIFGVSFAFTALAFGISYSIPIAKLIRKYSQKKRNTWKMER
ncbi:hypothetical protein F4818DRAFT_441378 [Hypoxylon cercidicola]|nr:hypothetical protein F4818DRAFT_441378 [Hypoxylon cercidicola]